MRFGRESTFRVVKPHLYKKWKCMLNPSHKILTFWFNADPWGTLLFCNNFLMYMIYDWNQYGALLDTFNLFNIAIVNKNDSSIDPCQTTVYICYFSGIVRISETNACCGDCHTTRISYASRASTCTSHSSQVSVL